MCNTYAQSISEIVSKEQAISILRKSNFTTIFRFEDDVIANVGLFLEEIENITPLDPQKSDAVKMKLLAIGQDKKGYAQDYLLVGLPSGHPPFIGTEAIAVLKNNFSENEYTRVRDLLLKEMTDVANAYRFLRKVQLDEMRKKDPAFVFDYGAPNTMDSTLGYFGI